MENVGESKSRNKNFDESFSRTTLIKGLIDSRAPAPVIFDVGGHRGESVQFLRTLFPSASIHSFEPDPASFTALSALADEGVVCHNIALSDAEGAVEFFRNGISHTNSLYKVNLESTDSIYMTKVRSHERDFEPERFNQEIKVSTCRLDDFCKRQGISHIDLLKIDVQGAEARVLVGAGALLKEVDNVIVEVLFFDYYEHQGGFLEVERVLAPFGFRLFSISEISNNPMNGRTDWAEVIYKKVARR